MALPLPGQPGEALLQGMNSGVNWSNARMNPILQREGNALQKQMQDQRLMQAWKQHIDSLAIQQEQNRRLNEQLQLEKDMHPLEKRWRQAQAQKAEAEAQTYNPNYMLNQIQKINQMYQNGQSPQMPTEQTPPIDYGSMVPGRAPVMAQQQQPQLTGKPPQYVQDMFKKQFGANPWAETEDEKKQNRLNEFREKENIKHQMKQQADLTELTPATRTKYQEVVREINSIMPVMDDLISKGGERTTFFGTAADTSYERKVKRIADVYMKAKGWPNTDTARNDAIQLFKRSKTESFDEYKAEMESLKAELMHEFNIANNALTTGKVSVGNPSQNPNHSMTTSSGIELTYNPATGKIE